MVNATKPKGLTVVLQANLFREALRDGDSDQIARSPRISLCLTLPVWVQRWVQLKQEKWLRFSVSDTRHGT